MSITHASISRLAIAAALALNPFSTGAQDRQVPASGSDPQFKVRLDFNRWHDHAELKADFEKMAKAWPKFLKYSSLGKSHGGRDIILMTINNPDTGPDTAKPGMYIEANVHGNEIQGAEVCLYTVWYLMENYGRISQITKLVNERAFYVIPTVNPDGRDYFLKGSGAGARTGHVPVDDDNDGANDEDGDDDLNGNGVIEQIRKHVPGQGTLRKSGVDPRILEPVPAGQQGDYVLLGSEGIDNDGDGRVNEDPVGGYDGNRNWASNWQPNYIQGGAMDYPFQLPEAKAVNDFLIAHPNVAGVQSYHNSGGMILRGPGAEWQGEYPRADVTVYDELGRQGERMLPYYRYLVIWSGLYTVHGGFIDWTNDGLGILSFSNELWNGGQYFNSPALVQQQQDPNSPINNRTAQYFFDDLLEFGDQYVEWKEFDHPQFGKVEMGGWKKTQGRVPPRFMNEELCHRNMAFSLYPGRRDAADVERRDEGGGAGRRRLPCAGGFHERQGDADDPREGGGEQRRPPRSDRRLRGVGQHGWQRREQRQRQRCCAKRRAGDHLRRLGRQQVQARGDRADRPEGPHAHHGPERPSRPHHANARVPRARQRRDDRDLRQRQGRQGIGQGPAEVAR